MEKINTEILIGSLMVVGFDKVDSLLYTYTLGKLTIDNMPKDLFMFEEKELSKTFKEFVTFDGIVFKLKEGYSLDTLITFNEEYTCPLKKLLPKSEKLITYLQRLDFKEIVLKKLDFYNLNINESLFSQKEINIINNQNILNLKR